MLSTNSISSVEKRRQFHRRQQSLEVPLATPLPVTPRRTTKPAAHRRGLSLDQSLSVLTSPTGFRPLLPQDQDQEPFPGTPPVRIQLDTTNIGHQQEPQHFVQETQQHRPAQPGYQAQDFQSHLQQRLKGNISNAPNIIAPTPTHPNQEQALQELQHHLEWYQQNFGHSPSPNQTIQNTFTDNQQITVEMPINVNEAQGPTQYVVAMPRHSTPLPHGHPHTMPNTPQQFVQNWPSPPATHTGMKHIRSQSFQLDVAPMPTTFDGSSQFKLNSPYVHPQDSFTQDSFGHDHVYASSAYSSSNVDPMSPRQFNGGTMPTLFEEPSASCSHSNHDGIAEEDLLLHAAAGASDDFNSPSFIIGGGGMGMSPRTAMMHNLGEDVNATVIDTGIPAEEVDLNISQQHPKTKWWYCLFELENGKRCGKPFKRKENARSHVQNHMGDRQFKCNDCGKTFVRQHDMKRHAAIHKDERPHICPCGSKFARHDALTRHRQRGMCKGALPGFERSEEDKPKRGRPKKDRPDQNTRTSKANKARQMDRENGASTHGGAEHSYASPNSSGMSEHSLPMTPPDTSDFDADAFISMVQTDGDYNLAETNQYGWRDTPPTSPASAHNQAVKTISPAMLNNHSFTGGSSPLTHPAVEFGAVDTQPDVPFSSAMSPEYGSTVPSSPFHADEPVGMRQVSWGSILGGGEKDEVLFGGFREPECAVALGPLLDQWLATH